MCLCYVNHKNKVTLYLGCNIYQPNTERANTLLKRTDLFS